MLGLKSDGMDPYYAPHRKDRELYPEIFIVSKEKKSSEKTLRYQRNVYQCIKIIRNPALGLSGVYLEIKSNVTFSPFWKLSAD
jgi:hypothetical protein